MLQYTRENPSQRYKDLLAMYRTMHSEGDSNYGIAAENMFSGISLPPQMPRIKNLIDRIGAKSVLDYGCGKALMYRSSPIEVEGKSYNNIKEYWGVDQIFLYDPGHQPYSQLPTQKADLVVCTDVLEHCPDQDVVWILKEIFSYASKGVYLNISCYPARKKLPNGENAHCTIRPQHWWQGALDYIGAFYPDLTWECCLDIVVNEQKQPVTINKETSPHYKKSA